MSPSARNPVCKPGTIWAHRAVFIVSTMLVFAAAGLSIFLPGAAQAQSTMKLASATINDVQHEWQKVFAEEFREARAEEARISSATPRLAPELMPNTKGPANGFLKRVCICNPLIESAEPARMAVKALGSLNSVIIISQAGLPEEWPDNMPRTLSSGI